MSSMVENRKIEHCETGYDADNLLVAKATAGDRDALENLCKTIAKGVFYRVKYSMDSDSDAEDASQEVLLKVCLKIHELRAPEAFRVWLGKIIIGETNRFLKKGIKHRKILNISDYIDTIAEDREIYLPTEFVESHTTRKAVIDAISKLPARQRQAVVFYYYDGLRISDIADAMELAPSSVSTHLARARESIKYEVEKDTYPCAGKAVKLQSLSMGFFIFDALKDEVAGFTISNANWLQNALMQYQAIIEAKAMTVSAVTAKTAAPARLFIFKCATVCVIGALCCGLLMIDYRNRPETHMQWVESVAPGDGKIVFTGGELYRGTNRVNPLRACLELGEQQKTVAVNEWLITTRDNRSEVLFSGYGSDVDFSELLLYESRKYGEYMLQFLFDCESGTRYRISSNFYIKERP
jgi:RNA polymerase sigma-70 factor (ECF subfamily)